MAVIEEYKKFSLEFIKHSEKFVAKDQDNKTVTTSKTFSGLKANVDAHIKRQTQVKPFDIIWRKNDRVVRLSSVTSDTCEEIWVSWKEQGESRRSRSKEPLVYRWNSAKDPYFYKVNPGNLLILAEIQEAQEEIKKLDDSINKLRLSYVNPITTEYLKNHLKK